MSDDVTIGELARMMERVVKSVDETREELRAGLADMVRRDAYDAKISALDRELRDVKDDHHRDIAAVKSSHQKDINKLEARLESARAPWWTWVTVLAATAAFLMEFLPKLI